MESLQLRESLRPSRLELGLSALNGLVGDRLALSGSPLSVQMGFYHQNRPLALTPEELSNLSPSPSPHIVVFLHGLASHEQLWLFPDRHDCDLAGESYGSLLLQDFRLSPLYLRYNSGLRVSRNGQFLASLLEELIDVWPVDVCDISLIGHSMGGLLIRSACHYAVADGRQWVHRLKRAVYLGTPHLGSPWEALGAPLLERLERSDHPYARRVHRVIEGRSAGMRDAQTANLVDEHWQEDGDQTREVPWLNHIDHCFVAGSIGREYSPLSQVLGDVLVTVPSAHARPRYRDIPEPPESRTHWAIVPGVKHVALAHDPQVYEHIREWMHLPW